MLEMYDCIQGAHFESLYNSKLLVPSNFIFLFASVLLIMGMKHRLSP
jgi:hypothetical protein